MTASALYNNNYQKRTMAKSLTCVGIVWAFLSVACAVCCSLGFYMPYWLNGKFINETESNLGLFRRCNYLKLTNGRLEVVIDCGMYASFSDIPSNWWKISVVCVGSATFITATIAFMGIFAFCIKDALSNKAAKLSGLFQAFSGVLMATTCAVFYPLGWSSSEVKQVCGDEARNYKLGHCELGWTYFLASSAAILAFMCPLLSCHSAKSSGSSMKYSAVKASCSQTTEIQHL